MLIFLSTHPPTHINILFANTREWMDTGRLILW